MNYKLPEEIISLSQADNWDEAKQEWEFKFIYRSRSPLSCLCGHTPIYNICVLNNTLNNTETEVGNCCVQKFFHIDAGEYLFNAVARISKDKTLSIGKRALEYMTDLGCLNDYEVEFYNNTLRKRKLSDKQASIRVRINEKFLALTDYRNIEVRRKIEIILSWAKGRDFDTSFVESLGKSILKRGYLTDNQNQAFERVVYKLTKK